MVNEHLKLEDSCLLDLGNFCYANCQVGHRHPAEASTGRENDDVVQRHNLKKVHCRELVRGMKGGAGDWHWIDDSCMRFGIEKL
ncbi:unnamed protein product [Citrullus colocynthis]|uniref:Uncharacterized protein n=1 Tax=Citrullus colocynthis TaxID=252529 RepID=A0ABP0XZT9_9ROSI